jgi:hypothetical protein
MKILKAVVGKTGAFAKKVLSEASSCRRHPVHGEFK